MKRGSTIVRLAWILIGLLAVASATFELGQPKTNELPFGSSFDPSGAAALAELLRRDGYQVQIDPVLPASLPSAVLAVAFVKRDDISAPLEAPTPTQPSAKAAAKNSTSDPDDQDDTQKGPHVSLAPASIRMLETHLRRGGNAVILGFDPEIDLKLDHPSTVSVTDPSAHSYSLILPLVVTASSENFQGADAVFAAWTYADQPFANVDQIGSGRAVIVDTGELAMNSFIDQGDNSRLLLDQIHLLAPRGATVELLDGSISGAAGGLIDALGPWAHGAQLQLILVGIVIVYALGKRFGLAEETARGQRSARDLLDGIADTYDRGRAGKAGLQAVLMDADRAVRSQLKLPSDAPIRKRNELLPAACSQALTACEHALMQDLNSNEALALARRLETELELFLRVRKPAAKRSRRRVNST